MQVQLGHTGSPFNKINKSFTVKHTLNGQVVGEFDERYPVIDFKGSYVGINYAKINGLYYYITGVNHPNNGIMRVSFRLDLLKSYTSYIMQLRAYVERDSYGDPFIPDPSIILSPLRDYSDTWIDRIDGSENSGGYVIATSASVSFEDMKD